MKLKINGEFLAEAFKKVEKVVNAKHSIPILQGIKMEATKEEVIFIGSDSTESLRYHLPVDGENVDVIEPGKCVLPKQASDYAKKIKKELEFNLSGFNLVIKSGKKSECDFNVFDPEEYPKLPSFDIESPTLTIKGTDFSAFVKKTGYAASESEIRPILQGINILVEDGNMTLVSTDSHRLGQVKAKVDCTSESLKLVIPAKSVKEAIKTFDLKEDVKVYCQDNQVVLKNGALFFYTRLLEGTYPDTSRLIPTEFKAEMKINREELLTSIDRVFSLASGADNGKGGIVKLHVNGAATITTPQSQIGKAMEVIEYEELEGEDDFTISFSAKYMMDALKAMDDEHVKFLYDGNMRPFLLTPCASCIDECQLVLPVRTY